jgi:hypothetical protein
LRALFTAAMSSLIVTVSLPSESKAEHPDRAPEPRAMFTPRMISLIATVPLPSQSPGQTYCPTTRPGAVANTVRESQTINRRLRADINSSPCGQGRVTTASVDDGVAHPRHSLTPTLTEAASQLHEDTVRIC